MPIRVLEDIIQPGATPSSGYADRYPKVDMPTSVLEAQRANQKKVMPNILDKALAVASVPYNFAKGIIGNPSHPGAVTQVSLTQAQKERLNEIAQAKRTPTGTINYSDYGSPTKTFSGISGMTPLDASLATTMGGTGYTKNPDGSINYTGGAYDFNKGNVITDFIDRGGIIGAADRFGKNIYDKFNPEETSIDPTGKNLFTKHGYEDDEYDFSGIEGQTAFNPAMKKMWDMYRLYNTAKKAKKYGPQVIDKGAQLIKKKITGEGKKIITKKKKTPTPPGEKGGPGYIPPKKKYTPPSHQTGGSGGVHSGMKTTKKKYTPPSHQTGGAGGVHSGMKTTPSRRHTGHGKSGRGRDPDRWKADGGLIKLFKYGGFLG